MLLRLALMCIGSMPAVGGAQRRVDERHPIAANASIRLTLVVPMATVRVIGWDRDTIVITGTIGNEDRLDGGAMANRQGAKWYVESPRTIKQKKPPATSPVSLEVRVPARSRLWIKGGGADVDIRDVTGSLDVSIVGGRILVTGAPREVNAEAMDGDIEIVGTIPWLRAKSAAGAVILRGGGDDVALSSVSGNVAVEGGSITRGRFETVTGDVRYRGTTPRDGSLTFDSHSGTVGLWFPAKLQADFDFTTISGTISNQLSGARAISGKDMRGQELGLTLGGGGARVVARTFKGGITLRSQ